VRRTPRSLGLLANADEADRQPEPPRDGDHDASLCRAIELRQHEPGDTDGFIELNGLGERILTLVGIEDEEISCGAEGSTR